MCLSFIAKAALCLVNEGAALRRLSLLTWMMTTLRMALTA